MNHFQLDVMFQGPSKDELLKKFNSLVEEYLEENSSLTDTLESYKENKIPEKHAKDALISVFNSKLNNSSKNTIYIWNNQH